MALNYTGLVSQELSLHAKQVLENDSDEILTYYIDENIGLQNINRYFKVGNQWMITKNEINTFSVGHSEEDKEFIRSIFKKLDSIIDLEFIEMSHNNGSKIDIYAVTYSSSMDSNIVGQAIEQESAAGAWWDIL